MIHGESDFESRVFTFWYQAGHIPVQCLNRLPGKTQSGADPLVCITIGA